MFALTEVPKNDVHLNLNEILKDSPLLALITLFKQIPQALHSMRREFQELLPAPFSSRLLVSKC